MRNALATISFAAVLGVFALAPIPVHAQDSDILGRWIVTSWTSPDGEVNSEPQRGLFIFTEGNYSMLYVRGDEPRALWSDDPTDAERLEGLGWMVSNAGRYSIDGDQLTYEAYVALNPNYMAEWPDNDVTVTYKVEDGALSLTWTSGFSSGWTVTLGRPTPAGG
jgi:hypothetical protein